MLKHFLFFVIFTVTVYSIDSDEFEEIGSRFNHEIVGFNASKYPNNDEVRVENGGDTHEKLEKLESIETGGSEDEEMDFPDFSFNDETSKTTSNVPLRNQPDEEYVEYNKEQYKVVTVSPKDFITKKNDRNNETTFDIITKKPNQTLPDLLPVTRNPSSEETKLPEVPSNIFTKKPDETNRNILPEYVTTKKTNQTLPDLLPVTRVPSSQGTKLPEVPSSSSEVVTKKPDRQTSNILPEHVTTKKPNQTLSDFQPGNVTRKPQSMITAPPSKLVTKKPNKNNQDLLPVNVTRKPQSIITAPPSKLVTKKTDQSNQNLLPDQVNKEYKNYINIRVDVDENDTTLIDDDKTYVNINVEIH